MFPRLDTNTDVFAERVYDHSLDMSEVGVAAWRAAAPCHACLALCSPACQCGEHFYCGILCQVMQPQNTFQLTTN